MTRCAEDVIRYSAAFCLLWTQIGRRWCTSGCSSKQLDSDTEHDVQDDRDGPTKGEHDECSALICRPSSLVQ